MEPDRCIMLPLAMLSLMATIVIIDVFRTMIKSTIDDVSRYKTMQRFNKTRIDVEFPIEKCIKQIEEQKCDQSKKCNTLIYNVQCDLKTYELKKKLWVAQQVGYEFTLAWNLAGTIFVGIFVLLFVSCTFWLCCECTKYSFTDKYVKVDNERRINRI